MKKSRQYLKLFVVFSIISMLGCSMNDLFFLRHGVKKECFLQINEREKDFVIALYSGGDFPFYSFSLEGDLNRIGMNRDKFINLNITWSKKILRKDDVIFSIDDCKPKDFILHYIYFYQFEEFLNSGYINKLDYLILNQDQIPANSVHKIEIERNGKREIIVLDKVK